MEVGSAISDYIRLTTKLERTKQTINFISVCLRERLVPTFVRVDVGSRLTHHQLQGLHRTMLQNELHKQYNTLDKVSRERYITYQNICALYHYLEMIEIFDKAREVVDARTRDGERSKNNKLMRLRRDRQRNEDIIQAGGSTVSETPGHVFADNFTNLTNVSFTTAELHLLGKGLKYAPQSTDRDLYRTAIEMDVAIKGHSFHSEVRCDCFEFLRKERRNLQQYPDHSHNTEEQNTLRHIKKKLEEENIDILKADKNAGLVAMHRNEYIQKMTAFIQENSFEELNRSPLYRMTTTTRQLIKNKGETLKKFNSRQLPLIDKKLGLPNMYGLVKLHKVDKPMRPIVTFFNTPTNRISKIMANFLSMHAPTPQYTIKNSTDLTERLRIVSTEGIRLVSFDVSSLYTNTPVPYTLDILRDRLSFSDLSDNDCEEAIEILQHILDNNYFSFNEKHYIMKNGLPMGAPISCILADTFMDHVEKEHVLSDTNPYRQQIGNWYRYVDDVLCLWRGSLDELQDFGTYLNGILPSLNFTTELEQNQRINFLDLTIDRSAPVFKFAIYRKPTTCSALIPADSCHFIGHKMAAFRSMVQRMLRIPLDSEEKMSETQTIVKLARLNGYREEVVRKIIHEEERKLHPLYTRPPRPEDTSWRSFSYFHHDVARITRPMRRWNIGCAFKTEHTVYSLIKRNLSNDNGLRRSGVYKIKCDDCEAFYLGETGRDVRTRVMEHRKYRERSNFGRHLLHTGHKSKEDSNIEVLHVLPKGLKLTLTEAYEIWKETRNQHLLNEQVQLNFQPLFKACE